jgi:threonine dehydrogenase-like Zn-dependent dehydrogenase
MAGPAMDALVFRGKCQASFERAPCPVLVDPTDVIVKVELCGLCGSDLHPWACREVGLRLGTIMGHEFVGTVAQLGSEVCTLKVDDRVASPFTTCCGTCASCREGLTARCESGQLFGWIHEESGQGLHGAQAQFVRVPLADATLLRLPADKAAISNEEALLIGDILSTGFFVAESALSASSTGQTLLGPAGAAIVRSTGEETADKGPRLNVAVVGCGPVGCCAIFALSILAGSGALNIIAMDSVRERLKLAQKLGANVVIDAHGGGEATQNALLSATGGRGADVVVEAVGSLGALEAALLAVRPGGAVGSCGCHTESTVQMSRLYDKNLTLRSGRCSARQAPRSLKQFSQSVAIGVNMAHCIYLLLFLGPLQVSPRKFITFSFHDSLCCPLCCAQQALHETAAAPGAGWRGASAG